jgi:DNA-binding SARP family transcriptional activator
LLESEFVERAQTLWNVIDDVAARCNLGVGLSFVSHRYGEISKIGVFVDIHHKLVAGRELDPITRLHEMFIRAFTFIAIGRIEESMAAAQEALVFSEQSGVRVLDAIFVGVLIHDHLINGDMEKADESLEKMRQMTARKPRDLDSGHYYFLAGWRALLARDYRAAFDATRIAVEIAEQGSATYPLALCRYAHAYILIELGRREEAEGLLARVRGLSPGAADVPILPVVFFSDLLEAYVALKLGENQKGLEYLRRGLGFGRERGFGQPLFYHPNMLANVCLAALQHQIEPDYVRSMIRQRNLLPPDDTIVPDTWPYPVKLYTLGRFTVLVNDQPLAFTGKTQKKPLELLRALIALGARDIPESQLIEALWPDTEGDLAKLSLNAAVHRLRKLLGSDVLLYQGGKLTLDPRYCWVDLWSVERTLTALSSALQQDAIDNSIQHSERLFTLYRGGFLEREPEAPWLLTTRERLRSRFVRELQNTANTLLAHNETEHAIRCCEKALAVEPLAEALYRGLIRAHLAGNQPAEAMSVYQRCERMLGSHLGLKPTAETQSLVLEVGRGQ